MFHNAFIQRRRHRAQPRAGEGTSNRGSHFEGIPRRNSTARDMVPKEGRRLEKGLGVRRDAEPLQLLRVSVAAAVPQERRVCETKADIERFGPAPSCSGCTCVAVGCRADVPHFKECRIGIRNFVNRN